MNAKNHAHKSERGSGKRAALIVASLVLLAFPLYGQETDDASVGTSVSANQQAVAANVQTQQEIVQELDAMKKRIEQLETALRQYQVVGQPVVAANSAKASAPVAPSNA